MLSCVREVFSVDQLVYIHQINLFLSEISVVSLKLSLMTVRRCFPHGKSITLLISLIATIQSNLSSCCYYHINCLRKHKKENVS